MVSRLIAWLWTWYLRTSPWGFALATIIWAIGIAFPVSLTPGAPGSGPRTQIGFAGDGPTILFWSDPVAEPSDGGGYSSSGGPYLLWGLASRTNGSVFMARSRASFTQYSLHFEPLWWIFVVGFVLSALRRLATEHESQDTQSLTPVFFARRYRRLRLGTILLATLSLSLVGFWVESHRRPAIGAWKPKVGMVLDSGDGSVLVGWGKPGAALPRAYWPRSLTQTWGSSKRLDGIYRVNSFVMYLNGSTVQLRGLEIRFAFGAWMLVFAWLIWAWRVQLYRLMRRRLVGKLCPSCGYDLRATPDRCPECGLHVVAR